MKTRNRNNRRKAKKRIVALGYVFDSTKEVDSLILKEHKERQARRERMRQLYKENREISYGVMAITNKRFYTACGNHKQVIENMVFTDFVPDTRLGFTKGVKYE